MEQKEKLSKEFAKHNHSIPSRERFRDLLSQLEKEYELLWEENQELKLKYGLNAKENSKEVKDTSKDKDNITTTVVRDINNTKENTKDKDKDKVIKLYNNEPMIIQTKGSGNSNNNGQNSKLSKIKKVSGMSSKSSANSNSQSNKLNNSGGGNVTRNESKRDGSHKWIRAREFTGHRDGIWEITASPWDILTFATASTDRTARVWTVDNSKLPFVYTAHTGTINSIRFHPMERFLCTASGDKTIHIFKLPNDRNSQNGMKSPIPQNLIQNILEPNPLQQQQQQQKGSTSNTSGTTIQQSHSPVLSQQQQSSPNQSHSPSQSRNNKNKLWTPLLERQQPNQLNPPHFQIQPPPQQPSQQQQQFQQQLEYTDSDDSDSDLDMDDSINANNSPSSLYGDDNNNQNNNQNNSSFFSNIVNEYQPPQQHQQQPIQIIQQQTSQPIQYQQTQHSQQQQQQPLHSHNNDNYITIRTPVMELKGHTGPVMAACWISNNIIVSGSWDNTIRYWNTDSGRTITQNTVCGDSKLYRITNLSNCPSNNSSVLTSSTDGIIRLWDLRSNSTSQNVDTIQGFQDSANTAVFTYDGNNIISGGEDKTVKVWDIRQTKSCKTSIRCPFSINRLSVSPNSNIISIPQDDGRISVYDIYGHRRGKLRDQYKYGHKSLASSTAWSLDDSVIYSCGFDRKVIAWIDQDYSKSK
ncbi:hypothetical protein DLAC_04584 [Tieghemostelium lacteum]|uniref:WD repeat-containing protein 37 n=1 Tax=Tieghemostelium lacteum TaxID=361077 RepID=A0A151ZKE1_TIELA|nr:hypothetical protein DLAC_04584 [Tieghemostelium lacteum]|eukprot:KYQ94284.1 hypothetical protein DLAC_04584 [Tieghemostelium lacteum]